MQDVTGAVIAAAGVGSRIGFGMPKCMIEVEGQTILSRLIGVLRPQVSVIHLVVGYREEMIIDYAARYHRDLVLARNPKYLSTNTAYSFALGARHLTGKVLYLDGDLLISPESLADFLKAAREQRTLVGLTSSKSEDAVFVRGEPDGELVRISSFSRQSRTPIEWANVLAGPSDLLLGAGGYVFERLVELLPLKGCLVDLAEVDTADDLDNAREFVRKMKDRPSAYPWGAGP